MLEFQKEKQNDFLVKGDLYMQNLVVGKTDYIYKKECKIDASFSVSDSVFYIKNSTLFIEDVQFALAGEVKAKNVNLDISAENQPLKSVLTHMPEKFKSIYNGFIADGNLSCIGKVKGEISKISNPHFNMDFSITNGLFNLKESPFELSEISMQANIDNGNTNNFETSIIKVKNCIAKTENGSFSGSFQVRNLNNYYLSTDINSNLDLAEVNHLFKNTPFFNMKGELVGNTKYNGLLSFSKKMKQNFLDADHQSTISLKNVEFQYKKSALVFGFQNLNGEIRGKSEPKARKP